MDTLTFFYHMISANILQGKGSNYGKTQASYNGIRDIIQATGTEKALTKENYEKFKTLLDAFVVVPNEKVLRSLGDLLCNSQSNDILTLCLIHKLFEGQVDLRIIYSSHDNQFFVDLMKQSMNKYLIARNDPHFISGYRCWEFLSNNPEYKKEFARNVQSFVSCLKLFDFDKPTVTTYSHAPVNRFIMEAVFRTFNVEAELEYAEKIDKVNDAFKEQMKKDIDFIFGNSPDENHFILNNFEPKLHETFYFDWKKFLSCPLFLAIWTQPTLQETAKQLGIKINPASRNVASEVSKRYYGAPIDAPFQSFQAPGPGTLVHTLSKQIPLSPNTVSILPDEGSSFIPIYLVPDTDSGNS